MRTFGTVLTAALVTTFVAVSNPREAQADELACPESIFVSDMIEAKPPTIETPEDLTRHVTNNLICYAMDYSINHENKAVVGALQTAFGGVYTELWGNDADAFTLARKVVVESSPKALGDLLDHLLNNRQKWVAENAEDQYLEAMADTALKLSIDLTSAPEGTRDRVMLLLKTERKDEMIKHYLAEKLLSALLPVSGDMEVALSTDFEKFISGVVKEAIGIQEGLQLKAPERQDGGSHQGEGEQRASNDRWSLVVA